MIKNEETYCTVQHKIVRELGAWEAVVYATIANLLRKTDGIGEVSNQTLIDLCGVKRASLFRYIATLIKAGYIEKRSGDGRGNISIYYITKKGLNLSTLNKEKGSQFETERVSKKSIKGLNLSTLNKGENKEINKESGGETRVPVDVPASLPTLSTTPLNFENMENFIKEDFEAFWMMYPGEPNWKNEKENCERVWHAMPQEWRDRLIQQLRDGKRWRVRENDNPYWYLKNYNGETPKAELPYLRQGSVTFEKWHQKNITNRKRMCLLRYEERVAYCLYSDLQTMIAAGATVLNDDWK